MRQERHKDSIFRANIDPAELDSVLRRIDENILLRSIIQQPSSDHVPVQLPDLSDTKNRLERLSELHAPLYRVFGSPLSKLIKRLINLPIRIFGRKQLYHNREQIGALQAMLQFDEAVRQQSTVTGSAIAKLEATIKSIEEHNQRLEADQQGQQRKLEQVASEQEGQQRWLEQVATDQQGQQRWLEQVVADQQGQQRWLEQVVTDQQGQQRWLEQVVTDQQGQHRWLEQVAIEQQGQQNWTEILQRKMTMLALDVREQISAPRQEQQALPAPRIVDADRYQQRVQAMNGRLRVNLGCGEKPLPEYINVDGRAVPDVDIIADVQNLPFEPGSLAEIASAHLVEHFREHQLRVVILPYWRSLLLPDGMVRIVCPNWAAMITRVQQGIMTLAEFKLLTFGGQDYEGDDHFAMYTPETLTTLLLGVGFTRVEVLEDMRLNGICPEMELLAYI